MTLPYAKATSGRNAMEDIRKTLMAFGASKMAPVEDFENGTVKIVFEHRGREVEVEASAKGYAAAWLRENPWSTRMKRTRAEYEAAALQQGLVSVWSILRDWIKGQVTAVECGILSFESALLGQMRLESGVRAIDYLAQRHELPSLREPRALPGPGRKA